MRTVYLIRHGETDMNKKKAFYGSLDVPINNKGQEQALYLRDELVKKRINYVFVSDMLRTNMTADLIFPEVTKMIDSRLNEKGFGAWEGLKANEIEEFFPKEWNSWLEDPFGYTPPEAENFYAFKKRVLSCFEDLLNESSGDVAIVSHLGVIRLIVQAYSNIEFWSVNVAQDSWLELRF